MAHHRSIFDAFVLVIFLPAVVQVLTSDVICSSNSSQCAPGTTPSELSVLMQMRVQRSQDVEDFDDTDTEDLDEDFMEDTEELFIEDDTKGEDELLQLPWRGCKRHCCFKELGTEYMTCKKSVKTEFKDCRKACTGDRRACIKQCKQTHQVSSKLKDCRKNTFGKLEAKLNACTKKVDGNCTDQCAVSVPEDKCKKRCCRKESGAPRKQYKTCKQSVITREFKDCTKACTGHRRACSKQCKQTHPEVASKLEDCFKDFKNARGNFKAKLNACMHKVDGSCTDQCAVSAPP